MKYSKILLTLSFILSSSSLFAADALKDDRSYRFSEHFSEAFKHTLGQKITHAIEQGELTTQEAINERKALLNERYLPHLGKKIDVDTRNDLKKIASFTPKSQRFQMFETFFLAGDFHNGTTLNEEAIREFLQSTHNRKTQIKALKTAQKKQAALEKQSQAQKGNWAARSEEEKREEISKKRFQTQKDAWAAMPEEKREEISKKRSQTQKDAWAAMPEEKREEISKKLSQAQINRWAAMSQEKKEAFAQKRSHIQKELWAARSEEEKKAIAQKQSQTQKDAWAAMPEEKREEISKKLSQIKKDAWAAMSEEEKKAIAQKQSQIWAAMSKEEREEISKKRSHTQKEVWAAKSEKERKKEGERLTQARKRKRELNAKVPAAKHRKLTETQELDRREVEEIDTSHPIEIVEVNTSPASDTESDRESD